ncbi:zinc finger BED domain-containing protein 4 [Drosophila guanche]|uniref:Blast:Zinc finger BED domain-containing protein 1 n=1 Tax=Drosophila guanche TaxID=7266 RepID=A0A3B0JTJ4_DROGU|nr:zinc finger BED domain-containing protein 4 [Drosophila guanche]SPP85457.1 blast:Zinc finger BED domain-containing protein 1 [Drosophila guanche]
MARSKVWKYYDKIDNSTAQCQLCERIIKTSGNTSNLMKHMKTHKQIDLDNNEAVVMRGIFKPRVLKRKIKKSPTYEGLPFLFEGQYNSSTELAMKTKAETEHFRELDDDVSCQAVEQAAIWTTGVTESTADTVTAEDIIEFEPKEANDVEEGICSNFLSNLEARIPVHRSFLQDMAFFVCRDRHPLQTIQGEGFKHLVSALCPGSKPPSVDELETYICNQRQLQATKLRQQLASLSTLSLSVALHNRPEKRSYLVLAVHFYEGLEKISRTLSVQGLPEHYTDSQIVERMERVCRRFGINKAKITCVVTGGCRLLEDAVTSLLGDHRHIPCFGYLLNTILEATMLRKEVLHYSEKVRPYVACYFDSGVPNSQRKLHLDVHQRPLSTFDMLEGYVREAPQLSKCVPLEISPPLSEEELEQCRELLGVLKPLASSMRELSRAGETSFPVASKALPIAYTLINELKKNRSPEIQLTYDLRMFLVGQLEDCFYSIENNVQLAMATLLDPRFRTMPFSRVLASQYKKDLHEIFQTHVKPCEAATVIEDATENYDIWAAFKALSHEKEQHRQRTEPNDREDEISSYFDGRISNLQEEPMKLWENLMHLYPFLHGLAKKYLHIPATAVPPASLFTDTVADAKLTDSSMESTLFLADIPLDEW